MAVAERANHRELDTRYRQIQTISIIQHGDTNTLPLSAMDDEFFISSWKSIRADCSCEVCRISRRKDAERRWQKRKDM